MAKTGRLRLKTQIVGRNNNLSDVDPFAQLWVDTGVFHLDAAYTYSVPEELSTLVQTGVRVQVPFNGREVEAVVLERCQSSEIGGTIKTITKILSPHPIATVASLELIAAAALRWASTPFDILRSAIPHRVASVDKNHLPLNIASPASKRIEKPSMYIAFKPHIPPSDQVITIVAESIRNGSVLLIAPDAADVEAVCLAAAKQGIEFIRLDSSQSRSARYSNYLLAMQVSKVLVIGARGSVFTPVSDLSTIIVYKESSYEHFEIRSPGWNVRDVVAMRQSMTNVECIFTGFVPSLEISVAIENKSIKYVSYPKRLSVRAFSSNDGALLPGRIFPQIRDALASGPVLFVSARKGYGNALLCANCKNIATCRCGAPLLVQTKTSAPSCSICTENYPDWRCTWCKRDKQYLAARGIERAAEEISRAFPGAPITLSFGDVIKRNVSFQSKIVIATPGALPHIDGGYSGVVILDGIKFFAHPDLRSQERARELFFEAAALGNENSNIMLAIDESHPIVAALARWNPSVMLKQELAERFEIPLPPFVSSFTIVGAAKEFSLIATGIRAAAMDGRIPKDVKVFGPLETGNGEAKIIIYAREEDSMKVTSFLHELQRRRSIAKKDLFRLRVNPYSLE